MGTRVSQEPVQLGGNASPNLRVSEAVIQIVAGENPHLRTSQNPVQIAGAASPNLRASQVVIQVATPTYTTVVLGIDAFGSVQGGGLVSQQVAEIVVPQPTSPMRISQAVGEIVSKPVARLRLSQQVAEIVVKIVPQGLHASQIVAEIISKVTYTLQVIPATAVIYGNDTQQFKAYLLGSNGTVQDVTTKVAWSVSSSAGTFDSYGLFTPLPNAHGIFPVTASE